MIDRGRLSGDSAGRDALARLLRVTLLLALAAATVGQTSPECPGDGGCTNQRTGKQRGPPEEVAANFNHYDRSIGVTWHRPVFNQSETVYRSIDGGPWQQLVNYGGLAGLRECPRCFHYLGNELYSHTVRPNANYKYRVCAKWTTTSGAQTGGCACHEPELRTPSF